MVHTTLRIDPPPSRALAVEAGRGRGYAGQRSRLSDKGVPPGSHCGHMSEAGHELGLGPEERHVSPTGHLWRQPSGPPCRLEHASICAAPSKAAQCLFWAGDGLGGSAPCMRSEMAVSRLSMREDISPTGLSARPPRARRRSGAFSRSRLPSRRSRSQGKDTHCAPCRQLCCSSTRVQLTAPARSCRRTAPRGCSVTCRPVPASAVHVAHPAAAPCPTHKAAQLARRRDVLRVQRRVRARLGRPRRVGRQREPRRRRRSRGRVLLRPRGSRGRGQGLRLGHG